MCCAQQVQGTPKQQAARQLTSEITSLRKQSLHHITQVSSDPVRVMRILRELYRQMLACSSSPDSNFIHYSASIHSTATVFSASWTALGPAQPQQQESHQLATKCVTQLLQRLEAVLPQLRAQNASNTLWSCAKLGLNPEIAVPGITARLISTVAEDDSTVPQELSNAVWAVATLKGAGQVALVDMAVVGAMCTRFVAFASVASTDKPAKSQEVSNLLWAAATLDLRLEAASLDELCAYLVHLVQQPSSQATVTAQAVSNALWCFRKMRHQPASAGLSSLVAHFVTSFTLPGRQPSPQAISNVMLAMAVVGTEHSSPVVKDLARKFVGVHRVDLVPQQVCNVIWSLAVLDVLDIATFKLFWNIILTRFCDVLSDSEVRQLYQVVYKLQPPSFDLAWQRLRQEVTDTLGPSCLDPSQQSPVLHRVLQTLQLEHDQDVALSGFTAEAVLRHKADSGSNVLLVILDTGSHLTNVPNG